LIVAIGSLGAGCNLLPGDSTSATSPSPSATTVTFSGSVSPGGVPSFFTFAVATAGPVAVTLTSLTPSTSSGIGLGLGTPNGTTGCTLANFTTSAVGSSTAQISVTESAGTYCAQVYDPGNLASASSFTISVSHS
jgi:hypothetical protein